MTSTSTTAAVSNDKLSSVSGWEVARLLGCHYSGDSDPLRHGGMFYDTNDWDSYGYARAVEFWEDPETGALVVQTGTIHRLEGDQLLAALNCCGLDHSTANDVHVQIEACRSYAGIEPDGTRYPDLKVFNLDHWRDRNIWKSVRGWIEQLAQ